MPRRIRTGLIVAVTGVWAANFVAPLVIPGYEPAPELTAGLGLILGALAAVRTDPDPRHRGRRRRDDD